MAPKKDAKQSTTKKRNTSVKAFEDDDEDEDDDLDLTDEEENDDEDEDDDEAGEDDEDDEDDLEGFDPGFAPFVIGGKDQTWDLDDIVDGVDAGENLYFYRPPDEDSRQPAKWYVLKSVSVGELPEA